MIITIQKANNVYILRFRRFTVAATSILAATKLAGVIAESCLEAYGQRPKIMVLSIPHTPMATKKTYPAKPKKALAKVKKTVKKAVKKSGKK